MLSTGFFLKIKFSKFLQTHFTSPIPIRMKKKMPYRVYFVMDYKKMPFRSTNFITLHGLIYMEQIDLFVKIVRHKEDTVIKKSSWLIMTVRKVW